MRRILFIMPALPGGGAEKVLIDILKNFDYSKYQLTLLLEYTTMKACPMCCWKPCAWVCPAFPQTVPPAVPGS